MKTLAITSILALSIAAPALAQTQLERSLGVEAGQFTLGQLVKLKSVESLEGAESRIYFGNSNTRVSTSNVHNDAATRVFVGLASTPDYRDYRDINNSGNSIHNATARAIFAQLAAEAKNGEQ